MRPRLIDYSSFIPITKQIKKDKSPKIKTKIDSKINNTHIIFNLLGIFFIIIGFYYLYIRNKRKKENTQEYITTIKRLNNKIKVIS